MKSTKYVLLLLLLQFCVALFAQNSDRDCIRMGNKFFREQDFAKAETFYRKALEKNKSLEAFYNLAQSIAYQGQDSVAFEQYKLAIEQMAESQEKKAWVYHNMGNMTYLNGRAAMKANDPDAIKSFQHAVELYKSALRCNPSDNETRYNLAMAQYMLKKNQNDSNNQQNQNDKNQDKEQDKDKKNQDKDNNKNNQDNKDNKDNKEQDKDNNQQNPKDENQKSEQNQPQKAQPQKGQMDDKTAEQWLNSAQQDEKSVQKKVQKAEKAHRKGLEKDW